MRRASLSSILTLSACLLLAGGVVFTPSGVTYAQDDEFDDEFDSDLEEGTNEGGGSEAAAPSGGSEGGAASSDEASDGDELGSALDEGDLEDEAFASDDEGANDEDEGGGADEPTLEESEAHRQRRMLLHNTWGGPVGGIHVVDAGSNASETFRAALGTSFFFLDGFLSPTDSNSNIGGSLSLSWTPFEFLEVYASLASYANSNGEEDPALFQVLGDTTFGVKGFYRVMPWLFLGGDVHLAFLNTVGDIGLVGESTSANIRLNATADLRELEEAIPMIARLNVSYFVDNSSALTNNVERLRYEALPTSGPDAARPYADEDRHLLTRIERYALQINRTDRITIGLGFEFPLQVMTDFTISPIAEYVLNIPVNRQGYNCLYLPSDDVATPSGGDGCLDRQGFDAFQQTVTLGARFLPPVKGLNIWVAADIGLTGTSTFVRELAPQELYNVMIGFGYNYDTRPVPIPEPEIREVEREVRVEIPPPPRGRLVGTIVEQGTATDGNPGTLVGGAIVSFPDRELTALSSGENGRFTSYQLEPGEVTVHIRHPEYHEGDCTGTIGEEGGDVEVTCEIEALPRLGSARGRIVNDSGTAVGGASVALSGPHGQTYSLTTGPDGRFFQNERPPGTYTARIDTEGYLIRQDSFQVVAREEAQPEITIIARPRRSLVRLRNRNITIRRQVNFATDSADILDDSTQLMTEIADVIIRHPELTQIEIQGHTDNRGGREHNQTLSQQRADAVRTWLVNAGVESTRLTARGYGQDHPRVPNITASNRARNRRVEFVIQERAEAE